MSYLIITGYFCLGIKFKHKRIAYRYNSLRTRRFFIAIDRCDLLIVVVTSMQLAAAALQKCLHWLVKLSIMRPLHTYNLSLVPGPFAEEISRAQELFVNNCGRNSFPTRKSFIQHQPFAQKCYYIILSVLNARLRGSTVFRYD